MMQSSEFLLHCVSRVVLLPSGPSICEPSQKHLPRTWWSGLHFLFPEPSPQV